MDRPSNKSIETNYIEPSKKNKSIKIDGDDIDISILAKNIENFLANDN